MNERRLLVVALGVGLSGQSGLIRAQTPVNPRRIGVLGPSTRENEEVTNEPFYEEMRRIGSVEGKNIVYDRVYGDDRHEVVRKVAGRTRSAWTRTNLRVTDVIGRGRQPHDPDDSNRICRGGQSHRRRIGQEPRPARGDHQTD